MDRIIKGCGLLVLLTALMSCEPDDIKTVLVPSEEMVGYAEVPVSLELAVGAPDTKAPLLTGADDARRGGVLFLVYRSATKQLDSYRFFKPSELAAASSTPLRIRVPLADCDIFVLGNLLAVSKSDASRTADLMTALGADFPVDESALEALVYRLDGGDINAAWRRETMAEVGKYGIPYGCVDRNVPVRSLLAAGQSVPRTRPSWMFARVEVTVDHGLFDGGDPARVGYFTNKTLKMKQTNLRLQPFSSAGMKALAASDIGDGDLDPAMSNGTSNTYVFFVPENLQGTAPEAAFAAEPDATRKNRLKVPTNGLIPAACRNFGTYVEFKGALDKQAGGFGGNVTYQFYLGANETTDFNLQRGRSYKIRLQFTADGLFHPDWRVQPELSDSRLFRLTADPAFTTDIGDVNASRTLAVRCTRPGALYVYMNPGGRLGGTNLLLGKDVQRPADFAMANLADCAWYGDWMSAGTADALWLAERGIAALWDKAAACLRFSVSDAARFRSHLGESRTFTMTLLPGGSMTASFTVKLFPDLTLTVAGGLSLTDEFYLGQKRTVSLSGFAGRTIKYAAVQAGCGAASAISSRLTSNVQWKPSGSASAPFPSCAVDAAGRVVLSVSDPAYRNQDCSGTLDVYAFYPNRFLASHGGWTSKTGKIVFFSEDYLNDSLEADIRISEPRLQLWAPSGNSTAWNGTGQRVANGTQYAPVGLNIDGTERQFASVYRSFNGGAELGKSSFDPALYERLLGISVGWDAGSDGTAWARSAIRTDGNSCFYVGQTLVDGRKLEELPEDTYTSASSGFGGKPGGHGGNGVTRKVPGQTTLGVMRLASNPATGLYNASSAFWVALHRMSDISISHDSSSSCFGWYEHGESSVSHYFMLLDGPGGANTDRMEMNISTSFRNGDVSRLKYEMSGPKVTYTVGGKTFGPVIDYEWTDETHFKWIFDASRQEKSHAGEVVPGELLVPYGEQQFTITYTNKWDQRSFSVSKSMKLVYNISLYALYAFSSTEGKVFVVPHRNADLLARKGASMSHAAREFCLQAVGVNFGRYFYVNPTSGYDYAYHTASSAALRGAYSVSNPYAARVTFNGATIPMALYRGTGMSRWTESSSKDFCWTTYSAPGYQKNWRYFLNWGGFEWLKNAMDHGNIYPPEAINMNLSDRICQIASSQINAYLNGSTVHNSTYAKAFSSADAGFVDIVRYHLWLSSQVW